MSISKQCHLLGVPRSSYYHKPVGRPYLGDELLMQCIDRIYLEEPTYGSRRMCDELEKLLVQGASMGLGDIIHVSP